MQSWINYLRHGLAREMPADRMAVEQGTTDTRTNLRRLWPFIRRHWRMGAAGFALLIVASLIALPGPLIQRFLIDDVILGRQLALLAPVILLRIAIELLNMGIAPVQQFVTMRFEQEVLIDLERYLIDRVLHFPKSFFDQKEVGYLMQRVMGDVQGLRFFFSTTIVRVITSLLRMVVGLVMIFYLKWQLAIPALVVLPLLILWTRYFSRKSRILGHHTMEQSAKVSRRVAESFSATSLIKTFASEDREAGRIVSEMRGTFELNLEQQAVGTVAGLTSSTLHQVASLFVLVGGAYLIITGQWTLGSLMAFQSYVGYVWGPARTLASINISFNTAVASLERVSTLFDTVPEENVGVGEVVDHLTGEVEFRDVTFSYDGRDPVLENLSVAVQPGEHIAIVGPSGVGKTTLVSLILRLYQPSQGDIYFDGRPASAYELASLRRRIGYVSQRTHLLLGTVGENLRYGNLDASQEQVERACQIAGIHEFIVGLPEGYDSELAELGANLSEGQKQRLAIARMLVKEPDIVILDEPTANLDSVVERSIFEALPAAVRDKTLFVVAHRLATVQNSDRILLLNEKRLVAVGTHQELLAGNEYYRSLVTNQQIALAL